MRFVAFFCAQCGIATERSRSAVSRARKKGAPLFCGRVCAGLHRRKGKTIAEKKAEKAAYDAKYRELHSDKIKAQKAAHYRATYNPEKARYERKRRMPYHVEYCRKPEYRRYKQEYDTKYRASDYGEFADAYMILVLSLIHI